MPVWVVKGCILPLLLTQKPGGLKSAPAQVRLLDGCNVELAHIHEMAGNGRGGGHDRADQVRAAVLALAALEVAIRGAGAALVRRQDVRVHADAHAASRVAPLE